MVIIRYFLFLWFGSWSRSSIREVQSTSSFFGEVSDTPSALDGQFGRPLRAIAERLGVQTTIIEFDLPLVGLLHTSKFGDHWSPLRADSIPDIGYPLLLHSLAHHDAFDKLPEIHSRVAPNVIDQIIAIKTIGDTPYLWIAVLIKARDPSSYTSLSLNYSEQNRNIYAWIARSVEIFNPGASLFWSVGNGSR